MRRLKKRAGYPKEYWDEAKAAMQGGRKCLCLFQEVEDEDYTEMYVLVMTSVDKSSSTSLYNAALPSAEPLLSSLSLQLMKAVVAKANIPKLKTLFFMLFFNLIFCKYKP